MDRNQLTGLIMMLLLLGVYFTFFAPEPPPANQNVEAIDSVVVDEQVKEPIEEQITRSKPDSLITQELTAKYGNFANAATGEEKTVTIETEDIIITFGAKGGNVQEVKLKKHTTDDGELVTLLDKESSSINLLFNSDNRIIATKDLYFNTTARNANISGQDSLDLEFSAFTNNGGRLIKTFTVYGQGYEVGFDISTKGLDAVIDNSDWTFVWKDQIHRLEPDITDARTRATIKYYSLVDEDVDYLSETSTSTEEENLNEPLKWISIKQKFFSSAIIADKEFSQGVIQTSIPQTDEIVKNADASLGIPVGDIKTGNAGFTYYFGPNDYTILNEVAPGFWKNVTLGWGIFGLVNKYLIIPIFNFLDQYFDNYGLIILLLVIVIRIILAPLTFKSHISMAKMKVLKPDLDEIKEKHGGDMQKAQAEQMQLYQKVGINPLSGCIPLVLQMPILLAMFYFFPNSIQLRQQSFLWAHDLSTYDSILDLPFTIPFYGDHISLFTLLMTASTILYTWSNSQVQTVQGPMKTVQYVMPVMFLFFLNNYAAGLTYYYFLSNIASFGQIALFRKFVDDDKIKQKLEENRKKNANKKKSSFQSRLEEAMKASQEQQKKRKSQKKK